MGLLEDIFAQQQALQKRLGYDLESMTTEQRVDYVAMNVLACTDELHEALNETSWKPWAKGTLIVEDRYNGEIVDAMHFLVNLCLAGGMTAYQLAARYAEKNKVNHDRQDSGTYAG